MITAEFATAIFTICNVLRVLAYLPQILRISQDEDGARAVSCGTWGLFTVSHLATVIYAIVVAQDLMLAALFGCNTLACFAIVGLTLLKRLRVRSKVQRSMAT